MPQTNAGVIYAYSTGQRLQLSRDVATCHNHRAVTIPAGSIIEVDQRTIVHGLSGPRYRVLYGDVSAWVNEVDLRVIRERVTA